MVFHLPKNFIYVSILKKGGKEETTLKTFFQMAAVICNKILTVSGWLVAILLL